jgi:hypothetical protein
LSIAALSELCHFILTDASVWGLMRIRQGNLIRLASDETEEEWKPRPAREYY